ncbi:hypothetical protein PAXRUDRAFT_832797 [Paxillus rubicundulus Ve08.2h10]|uniref:Uncharacterized protein n=1 Tax=Paxillus rubicundulus Ve08.2h10 TaxID=930991 RepID=A0A0D0DQC7_9AGAM|nr:hypothetical protein PAXRUDRAFT_832797 [Paxillus rubicundulus Ve08.2h10]
MSPRVVAWAESGNTGTTISTQQGLVQFYCLTHRLLIDLYWPEKVSRVGLDNNLTVSGSWFSKYEQAPARSLKRTKRTREVEVTGKDDCGFQVRLIRVTLHRTRFILVLQGIKF